MLRIVCTIFCIICSIGSNAQTTSFLGVRQNALGNAALNIGDIWAVKNNPGAFAFDSLSEFGTIYQNRYILNELSNQGIAIGHHTKSGNFGLFLQHYGFSLYRSMQLGGTYSLTLSPKLGMGISLGYQQTRFGDIYGFKHHILANIGMQFWASPTVAIGASIQNVNRSKLSAFENEKLPTIFALGVFYKASSRVNWYIDLEKEITRQFNLKIGLELKAHDHFYLRFGSNTYPFKSSFGFGLFLKKTQINFAAIWHSQIGLAPSIGITYTF